ncbi:MAG: hypothetical protein WC114_12230 [Smithellaceae bacterium]
MTGYDSAYVAGLIDGEGCVYIAKVGGRHQLRLQIVLAKRSAAVLRWLVTKVGGRLFDLGRNNPRWDDEVLWKCNGQEAACVLRKVQPFLRIKSQQAELGIKMEAIRQELIPPWGKQARWTNEAQSDCETIRLAIMQVNATGPRVGADDVTAHYPTARRLAQRVGDRWVTFQRDMLSPTGWEPFSGTWPNSGMVVHGEFWTLNGSEWPSDAAVCSLSDVLETGDVPPKFFLSPKACRGILRRAGKRVRELPAALARALEAVASEGVDSPDLQSQGE